MSGDTTSKQTLRWPSAIFGGVVGALFAIVVIAAAGYNKRDQLRAWLLADEDVRLSHLESRVAELSLHLDQLAAQTAQTAQAAHEPPDTVKLEGEIADLKRSIPSEGLLLRLTERVDAAERAERDLGAGHALLLTVGQLRDAVDRGDRFSAELAATRQLAKGDEISLLDSFAPGADSGIERRDQLSREFKPLSEKLLQQEADAEEPGFWHMIARHLRKVVAIRRMDGRGNDAEAVLARADSAFRDNDWDRALEEMRALPGPYLDTAGNWLRQAKLRLAADRALSQLAAATAARTAPLSSKSP